MVYPNGRCHPSISRRTPPGVWSRTCSRGPRPSSALPPGEPVERLADDGDVITSRSALVEWAARQLAEQPL
jgi:hypothetical protein